MSKYKTIIANRKLIIKALKSGVSIKRICERLNVDRVSFYKALKQDDDMRHALEYYKTFVENLFA